MKTDVTEDKVDMDRRLEEVSKQSASEKHHDILRVSFSSVVLVSGCTLASPGEFLK